MDPVQQQQQQQQQQRTDATESNPNTLPPEAISLATRLFNAARNNDLPLLSTALSHNPKIANLTNEKGDSLVMLSSYHGHAELTRLLCEKGADPNRVNDRGQSPLAGVVFKNERDCVGVLLAFGADPRLGGPSALECCAVFKHDEFLALFEEQVRKLELAESSIGNGNGVNGVNGANGANGHDGVNGSS